MRLCEDLSELAYKWHRFGVHLGFTTAELEAIREQVAGHASSKAATCFSRVLEAWGKGEPQNYNAQTLVKALRYIDCGGLAREMESTSSEYNYDNSTLPK